VSGAPGAGKSSLAGRLAAELGFTLITKDTLKETLHDALGAPEPDLAWSRRLGGAAMELLWRLAAGAPGARAEGAAGRGDERVRPAGRDRRARPRGHHRPGRRAR